MSISIEASPLSAVAAGDAMSRGLLACPPDASLGKVAAMMAVNEVHAVAIDDGSGIVTALDVATAPATAAAADVAHAPPVTFLSDPLTTAAGLMSESGCGHVFVLDPSSTLFVGMISTLDVAAVVAGRDPSAIRVVRPRPARPAISTARLERVIVAEAMHPGVLTCPPGTPLRDVAAAMADHRVHMLLVGGAAVDGVAIARAAISGAAEPAAADVQRIGAHETLATAADMMRHSGATHLLVTAGDQGDAGVISAFDVVDVLAVGG